MKNEDQIKNMIDFIYSKRILVPIKKSEFEYNHSLFQQQELLRWVLKNEN